MDEVTDKAVGIGAMIEEWIVHQSADFLVGIVFFVLILIIGHFVIKSFCAIFRAFLHSNKRVSDILEDFAVKILQKGLWVILIMLALPALGVNIGPLIAGLGVSGFIVGFAFQETLGNLASGLMLLLNEPFKKGDLIEAGGVLGTVNEMNIMATTLITLDNKMVMLPNKGIWGGSITNYVSLGTRRVDLTMGLSYGSDINKAKAVAMRVLTECDMVLADPAPQVEVSEMADSSVNFVVRPWCKSDDYWDVYWYVNHHIKEALDANGIVIPFPQLDVHQKGD